MYERLLFELVGVVRFTIRSVKESLVVVLSRFVAVIIIAVVVVAIVAPKVLAVVFVVVIMIIVVFVQIVVISTVVGSIPLAISVVFGGDLPLKVALILIMVALVM